MTFFNQRLLERADTGGGTDGPISQLMALEANATRRACSPTPWWPTSPLTSATTAAAVRRHRALPSKRARWQRTAMAVRSLQVFGSPAMKEELDSRIARARAYMATAKASTNDEAAMQILGLHWVGGNAATVNTLGKTLAGAQHADGGWGQNRNLASDAYATGQTLYALKESGFLSASTRSIKRA